jgi:sulfatase modifying factor 1
MGAALVVAGSLASGCLVSFDGYQPLDNGGSGDVAATSSGGGATAGKSSGGSKASGGKPNGGSNNGGSGATDPLGGDGGEVTGGSSVGGNGGSSVGGNGGTSTSGSAGTAAGGKAGNGGAGGTTAGNGGTFSQSGTGGGGGSGGGGGKTCPVNLKGPQMIEIPKPGGGIYCMDRTEVTSSDYKLFLDANVATSGQGSECSWNTDYLPDTTNACTTASGAYDPNVRPKWPVSCVDWCDAKRYCGWAGKRLCGAIAGGSNPPSSYIDPAADQWYRACSKAGTLKFPYGNSYQGTYCVGVDSPGTQPSQVASAALCVGGYDGLYDLSGNVAEWEDSCSAASGATDNCLIRGGSILDAETTAPSLLCNDSAISDATPMPATQKRNAKDQMVGLRCCYDP